MGSRSLSGMGTQPRCAPLLALDSRATALQQDHAGGRDLLAFQADKHELEGEADGCPGRRDRRGLRVGRGVREAPRMSRWPAIEHALAWLLAVLALVVLNLLGLITPFVI